MSKRRSKEVSGGRVKKSLNVIPNTTVTVTDEAAARMREALSQSSSAGIRIRAKRDERGKVSFSLEIEEEVRRDDLVIEDKGAKFFVDPSSTRVMQSIEIRYVKTEKGSGFAIWNPASG